MLVFIRASPHNDLYMNETFMMSIRVEKRSGKWNACKMKSFGPQTMATTALSAIHKKISAHTLIQIHASCLCYCCHGHCTKLKNRRNVYTVKSLTKDGSNHKTHKMIIVSSCSSIGPIHWTQVSENEDVVRAAPIGYSQATYVWLTSLLYGVHLMSEVWHCMYIYIFFDNNMRTTLYWHFPHGMIQYGDKRVPLRGSCV